MNNLNLRNTNSIEKQLNDMEIKKGKNIIGLKTMFKVTLLKKIQHNTTTEIQQQKKDSGQRRQH